DAGEGIASLDRSPEEAGGGRATVDPGALLRCREPQAQQLVGEGPQEIEADEDADQTEQREAPGTGAGTLPGGGGGGGGGGGDGDGESRVRRATRGGDAWASAKRRRESTHLRKRVRKSLISRHDLQGRTSRRGGTGWERRDQEPGPRGRSGPPAPGRVLRERPLTPGARQGSDVLISAGHFGEGAG